MVVNCSSKGFRNAETGIIGKDAATPQVRAAGAPRRGLFAVAAFCRRLAAAGIAGKLALALAAASLGHLPPAHGQVTEVELWSTTLNVSNIGLTRAGCQNTSSVSLDRCTNTNRLPDDDFNLSDDSTDYSILELYAFSLDVGGLGSAGAITLRLSPILTEDAGDRLTLHLGTTKLAFADAGRFAYSSATPTQVLYQWDDAGVSWTDGQDVAVRITGIGGTFLSGLTLADGATDIPLSPAFTGGTLSYTADVANAVDEITVTPTKNDDGDEVAYLDGDDNALTDANTTATGTGFQAALVLGENVIKVKVTAEDDTTTEYTLTVTRAAVPPVLSVADASGDEDDEGVTFTATLSAASTREVTATWTASIETGDTATDDDLAATTTGTVTIPANSTTATFTVPVENDTADEGDETFTVTLSGAANATVSTSAGSATGTITDDDGVAQTATCNSPPDGKTEIWCTTMTVGNTSGVYPGYSSSAGSLGEDEFTIDGTDYKVINLFQDDSDHLFVFGVQDAATNTAVDLPDDGNLTLQLKNKTATGFWSFDLEDDENTQVGRYEIGTGDQDAKLPSGHAIGDTVLVRLLTSAAATTLPTLSVADASGAEADGVTFTATLSAASASEVTATWTASIETGDTATDDDLAATKTGTVTIPANSTTATFTVPVENDTIDEDDETFTVTLSNVNNATLDDAVATGTIEDATANNAPVFADASLTRSFAENPTAGTNVGAVIPEATDADTGDTLTYTMEGTHADSFTFDAATRQIKTKAGVVYDYEATRFGYSVTIRASDGTDSDTVTVTITLTDQADTGDLSLEPTPGDATVTRKSQATYSLRIEGSWTTAVTPAGVPTGNPHFTDFVGGIHNGKVTFLAAGDNASAGIEAMAEAGTTSTLAAEVAAQTPNADRSIILGAPGITGNTTHPGITLTTDHRRITLTSMIAPTPDWFVGVSGLSLLDSAGEWLETHTVNLYPWDAGTEDGDGFSLNNANTSPKEPIKSIRGRGQFTGEPIARLVFTRTAVDLAPLAPTSLEATPGDAEVTLSWDAPASDSGIVRHEHRHKSGSDNFPETWTPIDDSAPGEANEAGVTVTGLTNGTAYTFEVRAVNAVGEGPAETTTATPKAASADATLIGLAVQESGSSLTLTPSFATGTKDYRVTVANTVSQVTVIPIPNDNGATVAYLDGSDMTLDDGDDTDDPLQTTLAEGVNVIKVKVTAEDGTTTDEYTVTVVRQFSCAAPPAGETELLCATLVVQDLGSFGKGCSNLSAGNLCRDTATLSEDAFRQGESDYSIYTLSVADNGAMTFIVNGVSTVPGGWKLHVDGSAYSASAGTGGTNPSGHGFVLWSGTGLSWSEGDAVKVQLTALPPSTDATLEGLTVSDGTNDVALDPTFASATKSYTASVATTVDEITVTPTTNDDGATVAYLDGSDMTLDDGDDTDDPLQTTLAEGANVIKVKVTAEDGTTTDEYTVTVTRAAAAVNNAPVFADDTLTRSFAENSAADTNVGAVIPAATDADGGDTLTYTMDGTDAASFDFDAATRQITTKTGVTYDFEAKSSYAVTIEVSDGTASDTVAVTINLTDANEPPAAPATPTVAATADSTTSLDVSWTAPDNTGKPDITSYGLQYRQGTTGNFTAGPQDVAGTSATITGLTAGTAYEVQVRAINDEGDGDWSESGTGSTAAAPPVAQTATCNSPPDGKTEIWCTTMTVGDTGSGYPGYTSAAGSLGEDEFTIDGTDYKVINLFQDDSNHEFVFVVQDADSNAAVDLPNDDNLTLELANKTGANFWSFDLEDDENSGAGRYEIGTGDQDAKLPSGHGNGDTVLVRLLTSAAATTLPTMSVADASGAEAAGVTFTATLSSASASEVTATWTASIETGDTATDDDLAATKTGTVTIAANATTATFTVPVENDTTDEEDQTFTVTLSGASGATVSADAGAATGTITDDDAPPTVSIADAAADEGGNLEFAVTLSAESGKEITVDYATSVETGDTATSGTDFTAASDTLTFAAGDTTKTIPVAALTDTETESDETFTVTLSNEVNVTLSDATATGTIRNATGGGGTPGTPSDTTVALTSDPGTDDTYAIGDTIQATVTFSAAVTVTGTPQLTLDVGGTNRTANYSSGGDTTQLVFTYTVAEGDEDTDGIAIAANQLTLNGGTIMAGTEAANLSHAALAADSGHKVDGVRPTFVSAETSTDGTTITVTFSENISSASAGDFASPQLPPGSFATATIDGATVELSPRNALRDDQTITLSVAGSAVKDTAGNGNLFSEDNAVTNNVEPAAYAVRGVAITSDPGTDANYETGDNIEVTVTFGTAMTVDTTGGTPRILLDLTGRGSTGERWAGYVSGLGTTALVFRYTVVAGDESRANGIQVNANTLELNGGTIKDGEDNDALLGHDVVPADAGHRVNFAYPSLDSAETSTDGATIVLTYDEDLNAGNKNNSGYALKVDGTDAALQSGSHAVVSGRTVTLTPATPVTHEQTVTLTYTANGVIEDLAGNDAPTFNDEVVDNKVLGPPANLEPTSRDGAVALSWDAPAADSGIVRHEYRYRSGTGDIPDTVTWEAIEDSAPGEANEAGVTVMGLTNGTTYTFEVRAVDALGEGPEASIKAAAGGGICARTEEVRDGIVAALSATDCAAVTGSDLATVTELDLSGKRIDSLQTGDFAGLTALRTLNLSDNLIETLPENIFAGLGALETLRLDANQIATLPPNIVSGLTSLKSVNFGDNAITELPEGLLSGLTSLERVGISGNELTTLPEGLLSGLTNLLFVNLGTNELTTLPENLFAGLTRLEFIFLNHNQLTTLPATVFSGLRELLILDLRENQFTTLPATVFSGLSELNTLNLIGNRLTMLPAGIFAGLTLEGLALQGNTVDPLPLIVSLELTTDSVRATAPAGAPFTMELPVTAANGTFADGTSTTTLTIEAGMTESDPIAATRNAGAVTMTVDFGTLPGLPSKHTGYAPTRAADLPLVIRGPAVAVTLESLTVTEGESATYKVVLTAPATGDVTVVATVTGSGVTISPSRLTFNASTWSVGQTVTVTTSEDDDADDELVTITHSARGANYGGVPAQSVRVTVSDDEGIGNGRLRLTNVTTGTDENGVSYTEGRLEIWMRGAPDSNAHGMEWTAAQQVQDAAANEGGGNPAARATSGRRRRT